MSGPDIDHICRSILPGVFYWKISSPHSDNHQLLKDHDDEYDDELGSLFESRNARILRIAALGLTCYGIVVMITCLSLNIFSNVRH
jgi:hypothetical protein